MEIPSFFLGLRDYTQRKGGIENHGCTIVDKHGKLEGLQQSERIALCPVVPGEKWLSVGG